MTLNALSDHGASAPWAQALFRTDGNERIGTGHVMRSIALAEACRDAGGAATFAIADGSAALIDRVQRAGFAVQEVAAEPGSIADALRTLEVARVVRAKWIVADGYRFADDFQEAVTGSGFRLLIADDYGHARRYAADVILNQNLSARDDWYADRDPSTRLLLGPRYALLRSEFTPYLDWHRTTLDRARRVLVTLGGSDPDNVTAKVLKALEMARSDFEVRTVVGGSNPRAFSAATVIRDARDMADLMAWADIAVAAGGSTSWELAFMGLPSLVLVLADNQVELAASLQQAGVSENLGLHSTVDAETIGKAVDALIADLGRRRAMTERGQRLVDGRGRDRVLRALRTVAEGSGSVTNS